MEVQIIITGGELLAFIGVVAAGVFGLIVYINRQDNRTREIATEQTTRLLAHIDVKFDAFHAHMDAKFDSLGNKVYDHEGRVDAEK